MFVLVSLLNLLSYLEIFSLESFISTNMAYTHITSFFSALPTTTRPFFSFDNGHSRGALHVPAIWGRPWFSSLVCFKHPAEVLFFRRMGDPFYEIWSSLFHPPSRKIFNFKSRTRSGRRRWSRFWLFYFSTRFLCRIGQLISWETDRTAVAYLSGWCLMCLFEVNGAWLVARWIKTDTHTKMISTACFWLLPLWPTGVK